METGPNSRHTHRSGEHFMPYARMEIDTLVEATVTSELKKQYEQSQITPEALESGFKAASGKATFDLIQVPQLRMLLNVYILPTSDDVDYAPLTDALLGFWEQGSIAFLTKALTEAFELLSAETGDVFSALFAVGELYALGQKKYSARNWEKGIDWGIVWSAAMRHLLKHIKGELRDPVDGQLHLTSVVWNILALIHFVSNPEKYNKFDSRKEVIAARDTGQK